MDAYEATRVVFSRIQALDPENAAKIMGLLLIQDHGEKEMIRLAFGPEALLHSVVVKARKDLGLHTASTPVSPSPAAPNLFLLARQTSAARLLGVAPPPLTVTSPSSWPPPPQPFSRFSNGGDEHGQQQQPQPDELISPTANNGYGVPGGDLMDELQLQDQLSFLNDGSGGVPAASPNSNSLHSHSLPFKSGDLFFQDELPFGGWAANGAHRRSCSVTDLCLSDPGGFGWRPCLYFARGYCKNGSSCRFLHGLPDDAKMDAAVEQQCHELLLRSKSQRLMAAAAAFPYSPTGSMPQSPSSASSKCINFLLQQQQQQQTDNQRAAAAAAAAALMLGGDDAHKFMGRSPRMERGEFAGMVNPSSRQIYLTFPADSTFREEDVSNYFSIYGPVQDVRIPYQQKRMFGFVTFVYPETVKLILAKGNPHFVCDSRVLVKPYKEKGKVPDKFRKQQGERGDFSGCSTPTGLDSRDPFDLQQLGSRMLYGNCSSNQDILLRRKIEEQQAAELQQAIEFQGRRFMGLQLLDLKNRSLSSPLPTVNTAPLSISVDRRSNGGSQDGSPPPIDKSPSPAVSRAAVVGDHEPLAQQQAVNGGADKEESAAEASPNVDSDFQEGSVEHNLPDSPFASPTKSSSILADDSDAVAPAAAGANHFMSSALDMASFKSSFFQMPRFSSGHGAVGMRTTES